MFESSFWLFDLPPSPSHLSFPSRPQVKVRALGFTFFFFVLFLPDLTPSTVVNRRLQIPYCPSAFPPAPSSPKFPPP